MWVLLASANIAHNEIVLGIICYEKTCLDGAVLHFSLWDIREPGFSMDRQEAYSGRHGAKGHSAF